MNLDQEITRKAATLRLKVGDSIVWCDEEEEWQDGLAHDPDQWNPPVLPGSLGKILEFHGDPLNVVHVLWAGLHGLNTLHLADKLHCGRDLDELSEVMVSSLGRAVSPDPSPRPAARRTTHKQEETS